MSEDKTSWCLGYLEGLETMIIAAKKELISEFLDDYKKYITKDTNTEFYKKWEEKLK